MPEQDPTVAMREQAAAYPEVDAGTACTQSAFRVGKKSFFFVGMQGGRYKAMFKLQASLPEAIRLAEQAPDDYQAGAGGWVTARFTAAKPLPRRTWKKWLDESYALSAAGPAARRTPAGSGKDTPTKRTGKRTAAKKTARTTKPAAARPATAKRAKTPKRNGGGTPVKKRAATAKRSTASRKRAKPGG